jgi:hypothetical protein
VAFLATPSQKLLAGFYPDIRGPLPFAFERVRLEHYALMEIMREVPPGGVWR